MTRELGLVVSELEAINTVGKLRSPELVVQLRCAVLHDFLKGNDIGLFGEKRLKLIRTFGRPVSGIPRDESNYGSPSRPERV